MKEVNYRDVAPIVLEKLAEGGVFLTVKDRKGRVNTMNIGWGSVAHYWNMPVFVAPVRHNRYTYELLQDADSFTVSVPLDDGMKSALAFVGTHHGNEVDKWAGAHIAPVDAMAVRGAVISQCALHLECKIRLIQPMTPEQMCDEVHKKMYGDEDFYTLYFGEIVACYRTDIND